MNESSMAGGSVDIRQALGVRDVVRQVLVEYQAAYFALNHLSDTVEDLRILSLNAELAAGRAGSAGAPIRVATQSTRELVNQLTQIAERMNLARYRCYRYGALAIRGLPRLARFGRTISVIERAQPQYQASGVKALRRAIDARARDAVGEMAGLLAGGEELEKLAAALGGMALQAVAIANNLAIEATAIRGHEDSFTSVAGEMHRHIGRLKAMIGEASAHVALGTRASGIIADYVSHIQRQVA